jgi:hypothetical protein
MRAMESLMFGPRGTWRSDFNLPTPRVRKTLKVQKPRIPGPDRQT